MNPHRRRPRSVARPSTPLPASAAVRRAVIETLEGRRLLSVSVTTWHNDAGRTGLNSNETLLTTSNVNTSTFGKLFSYAVTGQVYAQPLVVSNLTIPGKGTHDVLFIATENNDLYAFDADSNSGTGGGLLWHVNLGLAAATPNSFWGNRYGPYHDINPQVGITSTPVIDLATGTMYVDAFTNDVAGQNSYSHHIHAIDITTGADKVTPMLVAASVKGNGVGGNGTTIPFVATQQLQRPALTLLNGTLYVTYSGYADTDPYHGWILGFNPSTLALTSVLNTTPNTLAGSNNPGEGGIWMTGAGLASDGTNLFTLVGNGDFSSALGDWGDSMLKIAPDPTSTQASPNINGYGLKVADSFTPYNQQSLADADADLGSGGGLVLPDQSGTHPHLYIGAGKQGVVYVVNRDSMGGFNASTDNVLQEVSLGHGVFSSPVYFNGSIYYHATGDQLKRYTLTNGVLSAAPASTGGNAYGATPSVSSNGNANGIIWDQENASGHQVLHAYDATTLKELYNSNQNASRDQGSPGVKYITPTIANGHVYSGASGAVDVYGLIAPPTTAPNAPTNLTATALGAGSVKLTWVDNADNEAAFKIERSTDGTNFTQIDTASANATTYTDTTASPSTLYYYRVRATNVIGDSAYTNVAQATTSASTGPVNLYHFDAGSGTTAVDSVGGNTGTLSGTPLPTWVTPGKVGAGALGFSGNGTYNATGQSVVTTASSLTPVLGSTATLDAWFKTTQVGNNTHWQAPAITGVEQAGGGNDINWGTLDASGHIGLFVGDSGGVYSTSVVNDGQWHNVAMTRDATTGNVQIYIDGTLQGSGTFDTGAKTSLINTIGALLDVDGGGQTRTGDNYFNGSLDEVRIYNQVLSANEIQGLSQIPGAPTLTTATANSGPVVHLGWTTPSSFTQQIEIDRKTGSGGTYAPLATVGGGITSYDDTTVVAGQTYYYVVKAIDVAGTSPASNEMSVNLPLPTVVDTFLFYNDSTFDGQNGTSNLTDRSAIATDKLPLLPGQTATFANYSSYSRGINGILIDVANLEMIPRFEDFSFTVGNDNNPANWATAPLPELVNVYPGRGTNGSTQITIIWNDNAIQNQWLQVKVLGNGHTGLASDYTFYFGNAIGETGNNAGNANVDSADELGARYNRTGLTAATITNAFDFNRDGRVDSADELIARYNRSGLTPLQLIGAPAGEAPAAQGAVGTTTAVATGGVSAPPPPPSGTGSSETTTTTTPTTTPPTLVMPQLPQPPVTYPITLPSTPAPKRSRHLAGRSRAIPVVRSKKVSIGSGVGTTGAGATVARFAPFSTTVLKAAVAQPHRRHHSAVLDG